MIAVTSSGRERKGEWLESMRLTVPARPAISSWSAGGIALSRAQTTYVEGTVRHAAERSYCANTSLRWGTRAAAARAATAGSQSA